MKIKKIVLPLIMIILTCILSKYVIYKYIFPYKYEEYIEAYSEEYDIDPLLVLSIIKCESNFDKGAVSNKGAKGLMQIMDSTGEWAAKESGIEYFTPDMLLDPEINIKIGCWYLNNLIYEFKDFKLVIAAYNGGSGNVTKWLNDETYSLDGVTLHYIPFYETKKYVDRVTTTYKIYKFLYS